MAFITRDSTILSEDVTIPPSFMTTNDEDPFSSGAAASELYPDARRNILDDINNAENTFLPPPPQKESLAVYLRVKPRTDKELELVKENNEGKDGNIENTVKIETDYQIALNAPKESQAYKNSVNGIGKMTHRYTFTKVFKPETSQKDIFSNIVCPKVKDFLEGQNQLLFTYGATSAGKTFTIQGVTGNSGIMPRAIDTIFTTIGNRQCATVPLQPKGFNGVELVGVLQQEQMRKEKEAVFKLGLELLNSKARDRTSPDISAMSACSGTSTTSSVASSVYTVGDVLDLSQLGNLFPGLQGRDRESTKLEVRDTNITYTVWISFAEIYNENIHDLLRKVPENRKKGEKLKRPTLKLSEDRSGNTYIKGLREVQVSTADEAYQALMIGRENLHFAATRLNQQSSRSHCIFTVKLVRVADPDSPHMARVSMLSFCDLAGSERISKTHNVGDRQKEAGNINTSLLVLGRCIKAIRHNQTMKEKKGQQVVPFRESKLTRLFKSSFTGLGKSSLIVCISQAQYLFDESVHVCKFASIASKVTVETYKEPPPKKVAKKSSRFSSMIDRGRNRLLSIGGNSILSGRGSIAWEAPPRKKSSLLPASFNPNARSTIVGGAPPNLSTFGNISEMEEGGEGDDTVAEAMDNTVVQTQYESLLGLVEDLKQKLIEERKKNQTLEKEIREELCEEFNSMLVEVESGWERRLQAEKEDAEKINEWRIGELQSVHRNRNKRRRENDSGEFQAEIDAHRLQSQLDAKGKEVVDMGKELEESKQHMKVMKETTVKSKQEQDKLQMSNTKLRFELAEQQRLVAELGKEVGNAKNRLEEEQRLNIVPGDGESDALLLAERSLASVSEELARRDEEVSDLRDLIQEAGDEFLGKEEELRELEKVVGDREVQVTQQGIVIQDLQGQLEESHVLLQEVNIQLEEKEQKVEDMEQELERFEKEDGKGKEETIAKLRRQVGELEGEVRLGKDKCSAADDYSTDMKETLQAAEKVAEEERDRAKDAEEKMLEAQGERNQLFSSKSKLLEQLAEIKENKLSNSQELEVGIECFDLKQQVNTLAESNGKLTENNELVKKQNVEHKREIDNLKIMVDELKTATCVDDSMFDDDEVDQLRLRIKSLEKEKESIQESMQSSADVVESLKQELVNLEKKLESKEMVEMDSLKEDYDMKVVELENRIEGHKKMQEDAERKTNAFDNDLKLNKQQQNELENKMKDLEEQLEASEKLMEDLIEDNEKDKKAQESKLEKANSEYKKAMDNLDRYKHSESNLKNELKDLEFKLKAAVDEKEKILKQRDCDEVALKKSSNSTHTNTLKVIELETRSGSLEKELATKENYIKELEDIIVEKEYKISELEKSSNEIDHPQFDTVDSSAAKLESLEEDRMKLESKLKVEYESQKTLKIQVEELTVKLAENAEQLTHQEKMKQQRDDLEKRVGECELSSKHLAAVEDELRELKDSKSLLEGNLSQALDKSTKLKAELDDARDETKVLKRATKNNAKDAQEVIETKSKNDSLQKEIDRLNSLAEANLREHNTLDVLKSELGSKSKEISQVQDKVEHLRSELGAKDKEISQLQEKVEIQRADVEAKEYDLSKSKEERDKLMEHYEMIFKKKQVELENIKSLDREKGSLGEIMAKATPSKQTGELREKLARTETELVESQDKLMKEEDQVSELKNELKILQKQMDTKTAQHEREVNRTKLANQKVIAEYKDTNKELLKRVDSMVSSPGVHDTTSPTLEADDSKTDTSLIEVTPVSKKGRGRGKGRTNRTNRSTASLASFEDSNTENEPEVGRPRTASVSRKGRVTRKGSKGDLSVEEGAENDRSVSRKRPISSRSDASVLKEKQSFMLSPVPEGQRSGNSSKDNSMIAMTPALKKKRKLCSMTPQHSEMFTPPTDAEQSTPGSVVKRQLRTRRQSKR
eukprot:GFUD01035153.1.p1 GENE.GFUD01035153.1~~GFUD01035153.1.p1  ORF type:complete len:1912 (+),score=653.09 GFUD01035153.1:74-5809(+)